MYLTIFYLLIINIFSYNNFNELKQDMENKANKIALAVEDIFQHKCQKDTFDCPVQSYNICEGTGARQCLNNFPTSNSCSGISLYSPISGIRMPNSYASFNLSDQTKYFICKTATTQFETVFQDLLKQNSKNYAWLNFGSNQGSHRVSPGFKYQKQTTTESCKNYDPRLRPWYSTNVYNRKKMIMLVQNSKGIHQLPNRFPSIQLSVQALLKTAETGDHFNIIQFSNTARPLFSSQNLKLVSLQQQIQRYNKFTNTEGGFYESVSENITKSSSSQVNYHSALSLALQILKNSKQQNRQYQNLILMFSGFRPQNYSINKISGTNSIQQFVQQKSSEYKLNISFFGFGVNMIDNQAKQILKNMTCAFDGIYFDISDIKYQSIFLDQTKGYYQFLTQGNQLLGQRWTNFYQDAFGLGRMTTVVRAAYYNQSGVSRLIGLAAVDVLVSQLTVYKTQADIKRLLQVTQKPFKKNITTCQLQTIRRKHRCNHTPQQLLCPNITFCQPKISPLNTTVIKCPVDKTSDSCCVLQQQSNTGLIVGLTVSIVGGLIIIGVIIYFLKFKNAPQNGLAKTYSQIYKSFKDFDQDRIRPQSQISVIKQ